MKPWPTKPWISTGKALGSLFVSSAAHGEAHEPTAANSRPSSNQPTLVHRAETPAESPTLLSVGAWQPVVKTKTQPRQSPVYESIVRCLPSVFDAAPKAQRS